MQNALGYHGDRGLLSSLVGWIAGNATPSFIEGQSLSVEVRVPKAHQYVQKLLITFVKLSLLTLLLLCVCRFGLPGWC